MAAFHSLVLGELPGLARSAADNFLAEFGLLGSVREHSEPEVNYGRWVRGRGGGHECMSA